MIISSGSTVVEAARSIAVSEQTFYRWRSEYGCLQVDQARRLKKLETENVKGKVESCHSLHRLGHVTISPFPGKLETPRVAPQE